MSSPSTRESDLVKRQEAVLQRIARLEANAGRGGEASSSSQQQPELPPQTVTETWKKVEAELVAKGFSSYRLVRVSPDYYDQALDYRRRCLAAPSVDHLCKSIVMENTRAHPSVDGFTNPCNSKYYVVIIQYTARLHSDKLKNYVHTDLNKGAHGKAFFNMRLAPEDVSDALSGFVHNAVTPVSIASPLPIIMSHRIASLQPGFFYLGGGEVDLKLGLPVAEFVEKYKPFIADCTYD